MATTEGMRDKLPNEISRHQEGSESRLGGYTTKRIKTYEKKKKDGGTTTPKGKHYTTWGGKVPTGKESLCGNDQIEPIQNSRQAPPSQESAETRAEGEGLGVRKEKPETPSEGG